MQSHRKQDCRSLLYPIKNDVFDSAGRTEKLFAYAGKDIILRVNRYAVRLYVQQAVVFLFYRFVKLYG